MIKNAKRRGVVLLLSAAVLACIAGLIAISFLQSANNEIEQTKRQYGEQINVLVVAKDIPARSMLSLNNLGDGSLKIERRPKTFTPNSAYVIPEPADASAVFSAIGSQLDGYTMIPLRAGEVLLSSMIERTIVIPPNLRAVSLSVSNVTSVSGYVRGGDRVDVIASYEIDQGGSNKLQRSTVLLQNVLVLSVSWFNNLGTSSRIAPTNGFTATILSKGTQFQNSLQTTEDRDTVVTLALSLDDATKLTYMQNFAKEVRLVLRRLDDTRTTTVPNIGQEQFK
jgi:pilus assembly protein CpaB